MTEAVRFLQERTNFETFRAIPKDEMADGLARTARRLDYLLPNPSFHVLHVAGTKGKGSVSMMMERILRENGLRTGLFTSPHLERLEERFAVNGQPIAADLFAEIVLELRDRLDEFDRLDAGQNAIVPSELTFFELSVLLAYLVFERSGVEVAILETGLGGRFDATNVCRPALTVVTSISFDHQDLLGETLEEIAAEKAGIIKEGIPVVSGVLGSFFQSSAARNEKKEEEAANSDRLPLFERTAITRAKIDAAARVVAETARRKNAPFFSVEQISPRVEAISLRSPGRHQKVNAEIALRALEILERQGLFRLDQVKTDRALANVRLPARLEIVRKNPVVLVDGAHNRASASALADAVGARWPTARKTLLFATTRGKDAVGIFRELFPVFDEVILTDYGDGPRAWPVEELATLAEEVRSALKITKEIRVAPNRNILLTEIKAKISDKRDENSLFCFTGSFYFAALVRPVFDADDNS